MRAIILLSALLFVQGGQVFAHTPTCDCSDNGDGTITCEGGYSDGSSAAGTPIRVQDAEGNVLLQGKMDDLSSYTFDRPEVPFFIIFDAGEGHRIQIPGAWILE
jgi:hypothetical protein